MATHGRDALELADRTDNSRVRPFVARHWRVLLVPLVVALLGVLALWPGGLSAERSGLLRMRTEERRALYEDTRRNAEALCAQAQQEEALLDRCFDLVSFLRVFPECDEACQAFANSHRRWPTR